MTWLPNFLSPLTGLIAAAIAVPALLVLYFLKLRRREMEVSSTLLWKKAIQDLQVNAPFQKLRRNLLLILQMMVLLALCLALSRPVTFFKPGAGKSTVILIDHSASMNAMDIDKRKTSRLDEAKRQAKDLVNTMQRGASALVIAFADESGNKTVQSFTTDTNALKNAIDSIEPTDRRSQMKLAYQLADANMGYNPDQLRQTTEPPDVEVFSDGRVLDANELSIKAKPKFNQIGTDQAGNIAVVALSAKRNYDRPTEVQIFARLANFGPQPVSTDVELGVAVIDATEPRGEDFKTRGVAAVNLPPVRWSDDAWLAKPEHKGERDEAYIAKDSVEFTLDLTTAATIRIEHKTREGDLLAADNVAFVSVPPPKALSVLLVTEGNPFMEKILGSLNLRDPQVLSPVEYEEKLPTNFDLIIFDRAYTPMKLPPAGNFIYFGSIAPGLKLAPETDAGKAVMMENVGVLDWRRDHPILKGLSLGKIYALEAIKLRVPPESEVLIEGTKGPLMVLHREGRSTHLVVAFNAFESHWPVTVSFPIFMYQAVQFMAAGSDLNISQSYQPGATPRIPRTNLAQAGDAIKRIRINGPGTSRDQTVPETGDFTLQALDRVGVYRTDPPIPQFERMAVNLLDENESNLIPAEKAPGGIGDTVDSVTAKRARLDLWWWVVACGAIPLLLIEWWVYTRRVHL
ncbi:BatA and WFA domain-containing protein [soil metagenome]